MKVRIEKTSDNSGVRVIFSDTQVEVSFQAWPTDIKALAQTLLRAAEDVEKSMIKPAPLINANGNHLNSR